MLADLAAVIEDPDIPSNGESLEQALALRDRLDARIVKATGVFEANGIWAGDASVSFVAWLRAHAKMTRRSAQRLRTLAVRLRALPVCAQAYADGSLSGGQIEAILARLDDEVVEVFAAQEAELVPYLIPMTVAGVSRAMGYWLARNRPEPTEPSEPERTLHLSPTLDDRWILDGVLDAEGGSIVATALRLATPDRTDLLTSPATRRANALVDICRFFLTTSRPTPAAGTARTSTWSSSSRTSRPAGAVRSSTGRRWTAPRCPGCSATAPCTGWS